MFETSDPVHDVVPTYATYSTQVVVTSAAGPLPDGFYELTIRGTNVYDLAGHMLDGDAEPNCRHDVQQMLNLHWLGSCARSEPGRCRGGI